jgi:hypothetical protein
MAAQIVLQPVVKKFIQHIRGAMSHFNVEVGGTSKFDGRLANLMDKH